MSNTSSPPRSPSGSDSARSSTPSSELLATLRVQVISCCDLPSADVNGKSDPYVIITFGAQTQTTPVIYETLDPLYGPDTFYDIYVSERDVKDHGALLHVTVMDRDGFTKDDLLGGCSLLPEEWFRGVDTTVEVPAYAFDDPGNKPASFTLYARVPKGSPTIQLKLGLVATGTQKNRGLGQAAAKEDMVRAVTSLKKWVDAKAKKDKRIRVQTPPRRAGPHGGQMK